MGLEKVTAMGGSSALHGQLQRELAAFGNAFHAADQPVGRQVYFSHATGGCLKICSYLDGHRQQDVAFIAIVHQWPHAQRMGCGPFDGTCAQPCWQLPLQIGRQARIARVFPVGVPAWLVRQFQAQPQRLPSGHPIRRLRHQFCAYARRLNDRGRGIAGGFKVNLCSGAGR